MSAEFRGIKYYVDLQHSVDRVRFDYAPRPLRESSSSKTGVLIGHVGDSRVYRIREGKMVQLTSDHSLLDRPEIGDVYRICSDGLCGPASDEGIHRIVKSQRDLQTAVDRLIEEANTNGGPDNITVVLAKVMGLN